MSTEDSLNFFNDESGSLNSKEKVKNEQQNIFSSTPTSGMTIISASTASAPDPIKRIDFDTFTREICEAAGSQVQRKKRANTKMAQGRQPTRQDSKVLMRSNILSQIVGKRVVKGSDPVTLLLNNVLSLKNHLSELPHCCGQASCTVCVEGFSKVVKIAMKDPKNDFRRALINGIVNSQDFTKSMVAYVNNSIPHDTDFVNAVAKQFLKKLTVDNLFVKNVVDIVAARLLEMPIFVESLFERSTSWHRVEEKVTELIKRGDTEESDLEWDQNTISADMGEKRKRDRERSYEESEMNRKKGRSWASIADEEMAREEEQVGNTGLSSTVSVPIRSNPKSSSSSMATDEPITYWLDDTTTGNRLVIVATPKLEFKRKNSEYVNKYGIKVRDSGTMVCPPDFGVVRIVGNDNCLVDLDECSLSEEAVKAMEEMSAERGKKPKIISRLGRTITAGLAAESNRTLNPMNDPTMSILAKHVSGDKLACVFFKVNHIERPTFVNQSGETPAMADQVGVVSLGANNVETIIPQFEVANTRGTDGTRYRGRFNRGFRGRFRPFQRY